MCAVYFGIELLFSVEMALAVPMLLKLKVPEKYPYFSSKDSNNLKLDSLSEYFF